MKPFRTLRVGEQIRKELAQIIQTFGAPLEGIMATVSEVRLSKDLRYADVWVSIMGDVDARRKILAELQEISPRLRFQLAQRVRLRRVPEIRFLLDTSLDYAERIDRLLEQASAVSSSNPTLPPDEQQPA